MPVVGNLAGPTALAAIGTVLKRRGEPLSALYTSNVEFYLAREERWTGSSTTCREYLQSAVP